MNQTDDNEKFKKAFYDYLNNHKTFDFKGDSTGGYLIPEHYSVPRKGLIAYVMRFLNLSYGWRDVNLQKELRDKLEKLKAAR
jgi:hypothetical protein